MLITYEPEIKGSKPFVFYTNHFHLASLGVGFFIVLSGFLITWIILEEYKYTSSFKLSFFWVKRCLRIWPLYFILVAIAYLLVGAWRKFSGLNVHDMPSKVSLLTFTLNFFIIKYGQAFLFFIVFLWSISVEEQLYLVWGIVLKWLKALFIPFCMFLLAGSLVFRIWAIHQPDNLYFNTLNWVPHFVLGSLIAYVAINGGKVFNKLKALPRPIIITIYFIFIINLIRYNSIYSSTFMTIIQRHMDALFFAFIIFEQNFCDNRVFNLGSSERINYLGKISYGLFCYHGLVLLVFTRVLEPLDIINNSISVFVITPVLTFAITLLVSIGSYKYIEQPLMSLKNRFKRA